MKQSKDLFDDLPDNQLLTPSGKIITFNDQQYEGINKIRAWLKTPGQTFFTLAGVAGSGKSTILKKILNEYPYGVVVSAPTHKAKNVIAELTGEDAKTLQSLLGLRADVGLDEFNPNNPVFNPIAIPKIRDYNFCIIDEASMVNESLFNLIKELTKNSRVKVLFVGDPLQIPPVGEVSSVVFTQPDIEVHWLIKVERQVDSNPLLSLYVDMRENIDSIDGGFLRKTNLNERGEGVIFTTKKQEFRKAVIEKFSSDEFKKNSNYCKGIAWKNDTVMTANKIVRTALLGNDIDIIETGDLLMGYRTLTNDKQNYNIIENSADYHVIEKSEKRINPSGINGFVVKLREDLPRGKFKFEEVFIVDTNDFDNLHRYAEMHDFFRDMAKDNKKLWRKYYEFRRNNLILIGIDKFRNGMFRDSNDVISKDLDYGYFLTAHKAQGSTYNYAYIMCNDISENWVMRERNQLRYTAMSRPTKLAVVLSNRIDL